MQEFHKKYETLNLEQKEAVDTIYGPVLVIAGPGSGKTQLLAMRVANILDKTDTLPNSILCLTFTDSAKLNMQERLKTLIGREAYKVSIHTFHSFSTEVINRNPEYFFFGAGFQPTDALVQRQILRQIFNTLEWSDPLKSYSPDHGFTFLSDVLSSISALKKGGITPENFLNLLKRNELFLNELSPILSSFFENRISNKHVEGLADLIYKIQEIEDDLSNYESEAESNYTDIYLSLKQNILLTLSEVVRKISQISEVKKQTTPITEWKAKHMAFNGKKELLFKDCINLAKHKSLAYIYKEYQINLSKNGLYDFEDMLLEVVKAFENSKKPELKYNYQEKYQYILVDEFQDTNGAQMRLLEHLIDSPQNEGNPNILMVGDDDQAIFKFQGANIQNMFKFKEKYQSSKIITLHKNYRSTQEILDLAMNVISQSSQRLAVNGIEKTLKAA